VNGGFSIDDRTPERRRVPHRTKTLIYLRRGGQLDVKVGGGRGCLRQLVGGVARQKKGTNKKHLNKLIIGKVAPKTGSGRGKKVFRGGPFRAGKKALTERASFSSKRSMQAPC